MEAALRRVRECHQPCPASHDGEMIRAQRQNRTWYAQRYQRVKGSARGYTRQCPQNRPQLQATTRSSSGTQSGTEDSVHLAAHVLVGDGLAAIKGGEALANLLPKPFVVFKAARNELTHNLVRRFARLRRDLVQLGFEFRSKRDFHTLIVGGSTSEGQRDP